MKQNQLFLVILTSYCIGRYTYTVSCAEVNSVKPLTLIKHEHSDVHSDHKGKEIKFYLHVKSYFNCFTIFNDCPLSESKHRVYSKRQLKEIDFNIDVNDLTEENRISRGLLGSRRHLKLGKENKILTQD